MHSLETSDEKFTSLISTLPNIAVQGYDKNRKVIYWNKASEEIYGYSKEEAIGQKLEDLIIPDHIKEFVVKDITNWYENGVAIPSGELTLKNKNGTFLHVFSSHVMLNEFTDYPEMFCVDIDLTEKKLQEIELEEKDRLLTHQSKMADLGNMLENIVHQWRQPLSNISAISSGIKLQEELKILEVEDLKKSMDKISDAVQYLSTTIDDFRNFYKPQKSKEDFSIEESLCKTLNLLKSKIKNKEIRIIKLIDDSYLHGFSNELIQVLMNIMNNAQDALIESKNEEKLIFINIEKDENNIYIKIKDNAHGINPSIIDKIFDAHFTTKSEQSGTGIGLFMSKEIITKHMNGTLSVENVNFIFEDKTYLGCEFTITIPK